MTNYADSTRLVAKEDYAIWVYTDDQDQDTYLLIGPHGTDECETFEQALDKLFAHLESF